MTENWKFYFSNVNGKYASISLNMALRPDVPIADKPWLLWVWIYLLAPGDTGLTSSNEAPVIWEIEKTVENALASACDAIHCGRITTDGRRELYFYGKNKRGFEKAVKAVMSSFTQYKFDLGDQKEADWNQYLNVLYPSDEDMQRISNLDLLDVFAKKGDTLEAQREVSHWIYFSREVDRELFAQMLIQRGYQIGTVPDQPEDELPFGLIAIRTQSITLAAINDTVIELFRLARAANGAYDGWEAEVITANIHLWSNSHFQ
ncbi:MAG TPA: DUF695 domain-containing protein [Candidatus Angelobacter sp.]|jgi:uncharacterized protein (TIGR01619 family)